MPGPWRSYTEAERAAAVGRALAVGTKQAAAELGIPRRTLSSWLQRPTSDVRDVIVASRNAVADSFWRVISEGTDAMLGRIRDPKTRAGEIAAIVRTAVESHALISGGPTSRTEATVTSSRDLTIYERETLQRFVEALEPMTDDELRDWATNGGLAALREGEREATRQLEAGDGMG